MSLEPERDQFFQYATFTAVGITLAICACYSLLFFNPRLNPFRSLQPATPTEVGLFELPPTWTPIPTSTEAATATEAATDTPVEEPSITPLPVGTVIPGTTASPTALPATLVPPTGVPIIIVRTATPRPIFRTATPVPPTPTLTFTPLAGYPFAVQKAGCFHSGQTFVEGTVYANVQGTATVNGVHIRLSISPGGAPVTNDDVSGSHNGRAGYFLIYISTTGSRPGNWYVWAVDANGNAISDPNGAHFQTNSLGTDNSSSCWRQVVNFGKR